MKVLEYIVWVTGILAALLIIFGVIAYFFDVRIFGVNHVVNCYHVANTFLLAAIALILFLKWKGEKD
jgi:hypothetical protein